MTTLSEFFKNNPRVALGFSGGADSAYLLYEAKKHNADIKAYFVKTHFQPESELNDAAELARRLGVRLDIIEHDILAHDKICANTGERCYYCKRLMFGLLKKQAEADGYDIIIDGTNASDEGADRPGMRAIEELLVKSPLRECIITKSDVRRLSREAGLSTWDKPAYSCLATRITAGERITADALMRIERAEHTLSDMGFYDFRVRIFRDMAIIQLREEQLDISPGLRKEIVEKLGGSFEKVLLDMRARKGSE